MSLPPQLCHRIDEMTRIVEVVRIVRVGLESPAGPRRLTSRIPRGQAGIMRAGVGRHTSAHGVILA